MAYQFPASVSAGERTRVVAAFNTKFAYPGPVERIGQGGVTGDESNADRLRFFQRCIADYIKAVTREVEGYEAARAAQAAAEAAADAATGGVD